MAKTQPESRLIEKLREELENQGWLSYKIHGSAYQEAGIPDLLCFKAGRALAIEAKVGTNKPTAIQRLQHRRLMAKGVPVFVIYSVAELREALTGIDDAIVSASSG